ncbi:MAG TPA: pitrilysin family protein [Pyrinomonadaceae bacterium]|nr:pitrilysin family protein [Pyrinomonadaceae bacterium]
MSICKELSRRTLQTFDTTSHAMRSLASKSLAVAALLAAFNVAVSAQQPAAAATAQATPPPPAAPRNVPIPKPVERTLPNGLRVVVVERSNMPLVSAALMIRNGGEVDPPQLAGLADMTASLLTKGTQTRTAPQIAEAIEALGGSIESGARWDASTASVGVMSSRIPNAVEILADVVRRPTFKDEEIERLRAQYLDDLTVALGQPGSIARYVASRVVFGDAPYGHPLSGTPESIARIKRDDIVRMHATYYRPDNAILVIGGDIAAADAFKTAERFFADWQKPTAPLPAASAKATATAASAQQRVVVIDKPDAGQAAVLVARTGIRRTDPEFFRGIVANSVLSGYSGRLNQEIRIKRGLSYGARSALETRRDTGPFTAEAQTKNESGAVVAGLLLGELSRLASGELPETELTPRKAVLIGGFARNLETASGLVAQVANLALYGLSFDEINSYINNVQSITAKDVQGFAGSRLAAGAANVIIVGDAKKFLPELQKQYKNVEVIPVTELDLNIAQLRKTK